MTTIKIIKNQFPANEIPTPVNNELTEISKEDIDFINGAPEVFNDLQPG